MRKRMGFDGSALEAEIMALKSDLENQTSIYYEDDQVSYEINPEG